MDRIKLLPEIVANQIAAGEVVNAPSNVVKEMMENSIDAGAKCVQVNYRNGGKDLIQIVDDGIGMSAIDARMAFDRHATSKIGSIEDVYRLTTFGFRGEALASIAAVSEVELRTRQEEDEVGTATLISGGEFRSQTPIATPRGAQFLVRNLFYNVPSRRKFIDGDNARLSSQIKQEFLRVALCNPEVEFHLSQNDAPLYRLTPTTRRGRIIDVIGKHIRQNLLDVEVDTSVVRIEGFVGRPAAAKKRNNEQYLFVNGRYFHSLQMQRAILRAYDKLIGEGCMPSYFIYLTVDADRVDVNVHPQKTTVKFADNDMILQILQAAVRETLAKTGAVPMMDFSAEGRVEIPVMRSTPTTSYREPLAMSNASYNPFKAEYIDPTAPMPDVPFTGFDVPYDGDMTTPQGGSREEAEGGEEQYTLHRSTLNDFLASDMGAAEFGIADSAAQMATSRIEYIDAECDDSQTMFDYVSSSMGAALDTRRSFDEVMCIGGGYAVAMYGGQPVVLSLCRVRERLVYEEVLGSMCAGTAPSQRLIFPETLQLSESEYELMEQHSTEFAALGFDVEYLDECRIDIVGRPAMIDMSVPLDELLYDLLHGIDEGRMPIDEERRRMAMLMARRDSAGYGRGVRSVEAQELLARFEKCDDISFTPSGAPIMAPLSVEEIRAKLSKQ